jgi:hypothetical protein
VLLATRPAAGIRSPAAQDLNDLLRLAQEVIR